MILGKRFNTINGNDFLHMMLSGAYNLKSNVEKVNALNVFPVPDGDTGTNMNLTLTSGIEELKKKASSHIGKTAEALSKGLLMGARGNSGVILSQLFRGFAKSVSEFEEIGVAQFAAALQNGVDTAYKAVVKPVEGTILTVSKEAAKHAVAFTRRARDLNDLLAEVVTKGNEALANTPNLLPVLKQVGVVDSGGQGLMYIYEGMFAVLNGESTEPAADNFSIGSVEAPVLSGQQKHDALVGRDLTAEAHHHDERRPAQAMMATEDIEFGYCTEFLINIVPGKVKGVVFDEAGFRQALGQHGDSLLVVADDDLVKVHIHAEYPGEVMNIAQKYGNLSKIKIENMRDQHSHILEEAHDAYTLESTPAVVETAQAASLKRYGLIAVSVGEGISDIFTSLGVDYVLSGGQTMNPSTEDIVNAVKSVNASTIYILPNNSNIIMAAQQAKDLIEDKQLVVIPSKTIPQGLAAVFSFQDTAETEANTKAMTEAMQGIRSGQITFAVRDTQMDGIDIKEGDFIGIHNSKIVSAKPDLVTSCKELLGSMLEDDSEIVTIMTGEEANEDQTRQLTEFLSASYPDVEVEVHSGGQPLYYYIFAVE